MIGANTGLWRRPNCLGDAGTIFDIFMASKPKQIHFISSHPLDLSMFRGLQLFFRIVYPDVRQVLTMIKDPNAGLVQTHDLIKEYDSIVQVEYHVTAQTIHWKTEYRIGAVRKRIKMMRETLRDLKNITFEEDSLCIVSDMNETTPVVRLLIAKLRRETQRTVLCRVGTCFHKTYECKTNNWLSWIENNLYTIFSGAPPVSVLFFGWKAEDRRFYSERDVIDHRLVFSNRWSETTKYTEIMHPNIEPKVSSRRTKPYVIFLDHGIGWLSLFPEMSEAAYIGTTSRILAALTDLYHGEDVDLIFKPHPRRHDAPYEYAGFEVYEGDEPVELMFMREPEFVRAVYSPVSTGVRTASMFGIPAYIFDDVYGLPETMKARNKSSLLDFSDVINVKSIDELALPAKDKIARHVSSAEDLEKLAGVFQKIIETSSIRPQ